MKLYLASFFDTRARLRPIRDQIQAMGHTVTGRWIDEQDTVVGLTYEDQLKAAGRDLNDIDQSDLFILDTLDENPRGGREVEYGYAMANPCMRIWIVGPLRNIFHSCAGQWFVNWEGALHALSLEAGQTSLRPLSGSVDRQY